MSKVALEALAAKDLGSHTTQYPQTTSQPSKQDSLRVIGKKITKKQRPKWKAYMEAVVEYEEALANVAERSLARYRAAKALAATAAEVGLWVEDPQLPAWMKSSAAATGRIA